MSHVTGFENVDALRYILRSHDRQVGLGRGRQRGSHSTTSEVKPGPSVSEGQKGSIDLIEETGTHPDSVAKHN